ncbi:MAG TPA: hypothetical protein PKH21_00815 [Candidatus Cloacimonadota bacterium]|nr:hypothetical protein [Candidatus Cloacimonadota bacterium]HOF59017.1 hypothetical protein [Candidatus Cloacimonadota bacterium]HOR58183.1 hypothetical protein [Candidatus Cloacimonadota bacterium]HPL22758.1 hypothetical protein [Candidatus Cloacimonadota bacterium]HQO44416.1 hypothetical protein [Candidatus Cloacimonadota bacterium]
MNNEPVGLNPIIRFVNVLILYANKPPEVPGLSLVQVAYTAVPLPGKDAAEPLVCEQLHASASNWPGDGLLSRYEAPAVVSNPPLFTPDTLLSKSIVYVDVDVIDNCPSAMLTERTVSIKIRNVFFIIPP